MGTVQAVTIIIESADTLLQAQNMRVKGLPVASNARSEILTATLLKIQVFVDIRVSQAVQSPES